MARWRHSFYKLVPAWLSSGDGEKVLYTLGRLTDGFIERARQSLTARFPTYSGPTGLAMLGDERGIQRGREEDNAGYARRLRGWRGIRGHKVRGNPYAMLYQIWNYFGGMTVREVDAAGNVFTTARDGTESVTHGGTWNWDAPQPDIDTPDHDFADGTDTGNILGSGSLILHCDGTPGSLVFLNIGTGDGNTVTPASIKGRGWNLAGTSVTTGGTGGPYRQFVYWRITGPYESFTQVEVACVATPVGGATNRFIGRAVNAPGVFASNPIVEVATAVGNGTSIATPALAAPNLDSLGLAFIQGRLTTYSAVSGGWTELDSERTAGSTGIGIDEQYIQMPKGSAVASGTLTLGATSAVNMIFVTVTQKPATPWYRFWLKLVPAPDQGIAAHPTFGEVEATGKTFGDARAAGMTWGQTGVTAGDAAVVKNLFRGEHPWKMAGTKAEWLVLVLGEDEAHAPDGTWKYWTENGTPTRYAGWRYWKL